MSGIRYQLFYIAIFVFITGVSSAQTDSATIIKGLRDSLRNSPALSKQPQATPDSAATPAPCVACVKDITNPTQLFLVYAPFALLLLFTIIFIFWINKSNFTLEDALSITPSAKQYEAAAKANVALAQNAAANNQPAPAVPAVPDPQPQRSTSRLLAFITGVTAILIAICLVSYYAYAIFAGCGNEPQLNALWKILMGLGIGIIPYGINVWNGNPKEQPAAKP